MDVAQLLRVKGLVESSLEVPDASRPWQAHAEAYPRVRAQVVSAVAGQGLEEELDALFPHELSSKGQPWAKQGAEAAVLLRQLAGWVGGAIEAAVLEQRIQAEAEARAKRTGFT